MPYGSLRQFLREHRSDHIYGNLHTGSEDLTSRDLLTFAWQVASGMSHVSQHKVIEMQLILNC